MEEYINSGIHWSARRRVIEVGDILVVQHENDDVHDVICSVIVHYTSVNTDGKKEITSVTIDFTQIHTASFLSLAESEK